MNNATEGLPQTSATLGVALLCVLARVPDRLPEAGGWVLRLALMIAVVSGARRGFRAPLAVLRASQRRASLRRWLAGEVKSLAAALVAGVTLTVPLYALLRATSAWWVYAWILFGLATLAAQGIFPFLLRLVVGPVSPADPLLRAQIRAVASKAGVDISRGILLSGKEGSARCNAYVVGLGRARRVVLDRALAAWPPPLLDQVVAHELGHWRLGHTSTRVQLTLTVEMATLAGAAWLLSWPPLLEWAGVASVGDPRSYPFLVLLTPLLVLPARLVLAWRDRAQERQADEFAVRLLGQPDAFADMLEWAATETSAPRELHGWRRLTATHPPIDERMAAVTVVGASV